MSNPRFENMMDEIVQISECDPELAEGIKWIDEEASKRKISFYEMSKIILIMHNSRKYAMEWLAKKSA